MTSTEELSGPYRRYLAAVVQFHLAAAARSGLGATDYQAINLLDLDGPQTTGELAQRLALSVSAATRLVDRLVTGGWVRRVGDPEDRRRVVVELTGRLPAQLVAALAAVREPIGAAITELDDAGRRALAYYLDAAITAYTAVARSLTEAGD